MLPLDGDTQERSWKVLKPGGILVSTVQPRAPKNLPPMLVLHEEFSSAAILLGLMS